MIKLHRMLLAGVVLAVATSSVQAAEVNGVVTVASGGIVTSTGSDLSSTAVITIPTVFVNSPGLGDFSNLDFPDVLGTNVTLDVAQAATGFGFNLSGVNGTFAADLGTIVTQNADFLNVYIEGLYTPSGNVTGDPGRASLNVTLTFNNGRYSMTAVLNAPPTPVIPEPSSIALAGIGLASAGLFGLRKRYSK